MLESYVPIEIENSEVPFIGDSNEADRLKMIVCKNTTGALNVDSGVRFSVQEVTLIGADEKLKLESGMTVSKTYSHVNVFFKRSYCTSTDSEDCIDVGVFLPVQCKKALLRFLSNGRPEPRYCCVDFVMDTMACYSDANVGNFCVDEWNMEPLEENSLNPGDPIVIKDAGEQPVHFAIYLIQGFYLSLFGQSGPLIITTLEENKIGFGGADAYRILSRKVAGGEKIRDKEDETSLRHRKRRRHDTEDLL